MLLLLVAVWLNYFFATLPQNIAAPPPVFPNITQKKYRNTTLLLGSIIFYAVGEPYYVLLLLVMVWLNYFFAKKERISF